MYFEELGVIYGFLLNEGTCFRLLLRQINEIVKIDKIIITDIKKYDERDFIFFVFV